MARLVFASLRRRGHQLGLAFAAVLVASAMCGGLTAFASRSRAQLAADLRAFGPNLLVRPEPGATARIESTSVERLRAMAGILVASGVVELAAEEAPAGRAVYAADADILRLHPNWQVEPRWPRPGEFALGARLADAPLAPALVSPREPALDALGARLSEPAGAAARVTTGEPALDSSVFVALADLAGSVAGLDRIEVRVAAARLGEVAREIERQVPGVEARPLVRVSESDVRLLRRVEWLLICAGAISLALALGSVAASTAALVGERRRELALMLALGHPLPRLLGLLAGELAVVAAAGALAGELLGEAGAAALARRLLGSGELTLTAGGAVASAAVAVLVVLAGLVVAVRRVAAVEPAAVLRGE